MEYANCPICLSSRHKRVFESKDYLYSKRDFTIVKCEQCHLVFTNPRVKESRISNYYFSDYLPNHQSTKPISFWGSIRDKLRFLKTGAYDEISQILNIFKAKSVLEIGPGMGCLLKFLKQKEFEVTGIEVDSQYVERICSLGIHCYKGRLEDIKNEIQPRQFDAVILCHVFEHLYDPLKVLKSIYEILEDNGIIYMALPNVSSSEAKLFGRYWRGLDLPRHVAHYDVGTIETVLNKADFSVVKIKSEIFPSSFVESIGFRFFKEGKMPKEVYYPLYWAWKVLGPIHMRLIGSGVISLVATKKRS